jgi:hypothetical protein
MCVIAGEISLAGAYTVRDRRWSAGAMLSGDMRARKREKAPVRRSKSGAIAAQSMRYGQRAAMQATTRAQRSSVPDGTSPPDLGRRIPAHIGIVPKTLIDYQNRRRT